MALQKRKQIGKYCFYGCWCLPTGAGLIPYGEPVDNIDNSCKEYTKCYNCLYNPAPFRGMGCDEEEGIKTRYSIRGSKDINGRTVLYCRDPIGTCARNRCECDKALSEKLAEHENEWTVENHHKWNFGDFDREERCLAAPKEDANHSSGSSFASRRGPPALANMIQSRTQRINQPALSVYGKIAGCCGEAPDFRYYREGQRCCANGEIVDGLAPCSEEFLNL
ncbi:Oidioi.mRNA.OKI2018_I69.chr2.g4302.t1.cds [Oikopleura dioica]|uniref:Oidioi.mRNA.OKI2018_I69.chr2.g4302.t1.cds n=1 Tax=Oikopleura dioica TaxID=34765 RepID=A0ABN7SWW9_OIKDI|nr:Oidioi.mRNA.OKI2018_I69.chr2.g4302.t1.cds [Oikopleura dioica]